MVMVPDLWNRRDKRRFFGHGLDPAEVRQTAVVRPCFTSTGLTVYQKKRDKVLSEEARDGFVQPLSQLCFDCFLMQWKPGDTVFFWLPEHFGGSIDYTFYFRMKFTAR
jgi:hypothetical protein